MKILVTGCGSIGNRHIKNLFDLGYKDVIGHDLSAEARKKFSDSFGIKVFSNFDDALSELPNVVFVTTPSNYHLPPAFKAADKGCHLFIEKPISNSIEGLEELNTVAVEKELVTLIGCNFRFHPGVKKIKELLIEEVVGKPITADIECGSYLPDWRPKIDYRKCYSARRDMGGGIILDSIHEIDYAQGLFGEVDKVVCMAGKMSSLEIDVEDVAEVICRYHSGVMARIHLDYIQREYSRKCKILCEDGVISWDIKDKKVSVFEASSKKWRYYKEPDGFHPNYMYKDEMIHFINCVKGLEKSISDVSCGINVLKVALAAKESAQQGKYILL